MELQIITGPMMAGKTTELLKRLFTYSYANKRCLYINSSKDTRSTGDFSTHNPLYQEKLQRENRVTFISVEFISSLETSYLERFDVIGIDEGQFFVDLYDSSLNLVETLKKIVIISGLDLDANRNLFGNIYRLLPMADTHTKLFSYCERCAKNGRTTKALFSSQKTQLSHIPTDLLSNLTEDEKEEIRNEPYISVGGKEQYEPLCRECYLS